MSKNNTIKLPADLNEAISSTMDYAQKGILVPMEMLLSKCDNEDARNKVIGIYSVIQRAYANSTNEANQLLAAESNSRSLTLVIAVGTLALAFLFIISAICWISIVDKGKEVPGTLNALASMLVGYVGGITTGILGIKYKKETSTRK